MRNVLSLVRLGALFVPIVFVGAEPRPALAPTMAPANSVAEGRIELSRGVIGPEGGTLVSPDGSVAVVWEPNPKRLPTASQVWSYFVGASGGPGFGINGAPGPATISCFPPREASPGTSGASGPGPDPVKPPEPVIVIEEGNGEWREVEAPRQANGARKVRVDDDLAPLNVSAQRLFILSPSTAVMRLGESKAFTLYANNPAPAAPLPPESDPTSDDYLQPIAPTPPPGGDTSSDDYLAPLAPKKSAGGSSAKAAPKSASSKAADRVIDGKLGEMLRDTQRNKTKIDRWTVEGVTNGNSTVGTLDDGLAGLQGTAVKASVEFTAPKKIPASIGPSKTVRLQVHLSRGTKKEVYGVDVRLLEEGEVAVEFTCTLSYRLKSSGTTTQQLIVEHRTEDEESFTVTGSAVMTLSESRGGGKGKEQLYVRMEKSAPIAVSYRAKLDRMKYFQEEDAKAEFGGQGETVTEKAESSGFEHLPAPSFTYRRESKNWEVSIPVSGWLQEALQRSSPETHKVYRPERTKDPEHFASLTRGWVIQSPPFDLPKISTAATESDRELTGEIDRAEKNVRYHVKWSVRR